MASNRFSIINRLKSFVFAFNGLKILIKEEHNARVHLIAAIIVISLGFVFRINSLEWLAVLLAIGMVVSLELVNSAIESLADFASPSKHHLIKKTKDLAAGGVLFSAIIAVTIGLIIFLPKIINCFR